jgi:excisionase family DNA binding protein
MEDASLTARKPAAKQLGVCVRTLDKAVANGELKATRIGRRVLFSQQQLLAYIKKKSR